MLIDLSSRRATIAFARRVASSLAPGQLVLLDGPLGAGKTFFARALLRALGVPEEFAIASPTFSICAEYATKIGKVVHVDFYRLLDSPRGIAGEIELLGLREMRQTGEGALLIAEWAGEVAEELGGEPLLRIELAVVSESQRRARVTGSLAVAV